MFAVSVGDTVQLQFSVYDVDGITPLVGEVDGDFGKLLFLDDAASAQAITVTEVGATGVYVAEFTPNAEGLWYLQITTQVDDVYDCHVKAGPPPTDWVTAITEDVWSELLPGTYGAGTAGSLLASAAADAELVREALVMANLTAAATSTDTIVHTGATQVDDYYNGLVLVVRNSSGSVARRITDFSTLDGAFTLASPLPFTPDAGDQVIVLGLLGEVVLEADSPTLTKLCDIWSIMGLDPEDPLCVSKTGQHTNRVRLNHTEVGKKVVVQREP